MASFKVVKRPAMVKPHRGAFIEALLETARNGTALSVSESWDGGGYYERVRKHGLRLRHMIQPDRSQLVWCEPIESKLADAMVECRRREARRREAETTTREETE